MRTPFCLCFAGMCIVLILPASPELNEWTPLRAFRILVEVLKAHFYLCLSPASALWKMSPYVTSALQPPPRGRFLHRQIIRRLWFGTEVLKLFVLIQKTARRSFWIEHSIETVQNQWWQTVPSHSRPQNSAVINHILGFLSTPHVSPRWMKLIQLSPWGMERCWHDEP